MAQQADFEPIYKGDTMTGFSVLVTDEAGNDFPLTGYQVKADVKKDYNGSVVFSLNPEIDDSIANKINIPVQDMNFGVYKYKWDLRIQAPDGEKTTIYYGELPIINVVSQWQ